MKLFLISLWTIIGIMNIINWFTSKTETPTWIVALLNFQIALLIYKR